MIKRDFMDNIESGFKGVTPFDIPSDQNKAYLHPLDNDGGIVWKQGIFSDPVEVSKVETVTPDTISVKSLLPSVLPFVIGFAVIFFILKVSK